MRFSKLLALLAILWLTPVSAQLAQTGMGGTAISGGNLLDTLTVAPSVAYSTRKLRAAYAGAALRVQRSSDNAQQDIGFAANGQLNTTALLAFVGSGNGWIQSWYDQSTNNITGNPVGSGGVRVLIVNAGVVETLNGNAALSFGTTAAAAIVTGPVLSQPDTIAVAAQFTSFAPAGAGLTDGHSASPRQAIAYSSGGAGYQLFAGSATLTGGTPDFLSHDFIGIFNGASSSLVVDGTAVISGNPGSNGIASGLQDIGGSAAGTGNPRVMDGFIGEYIIFPAALGATDQAKIRTSWQTQWGTQ